MFHELPSEFSLQLGVLPCPDFSRILSVSADNNKAGVEKSTKNGSRQEVGRVEDPLSKCWTSDEVEFAFEHGQSWNWPRVFGTIISEQLNIEQQDT
jgi:hypothetical protein